MVSKETQKLLKKGIVTNEMVAEAAYSYDMRGNNWRDVQYEYYEYRTEMRNNGYYYCDKFDNEHKAKLKKEEYYRKKDELLSYFKPIKIQAKWLKRYINGEKEYAYYLYYDICDNDFITPITKEEAIASGLEIERISDKFKTYGTYIEYLMSCQTADKIRNGLKEGIYKIVN